MKKKNKHHKTHAQKNTQNIVVILVAVAVIVISGILTVGFSNLSLTGGSDSDMYKNVTFTDAVLTCEQKVKKEFGSSLSQSVVDNHSSRYENNVGLYKIFIQAYEKNKKGVTEHYVTCYVAARNGKVDTFEVFENKEAPQGKAIKKNGDKLFDWPQ